jgi:hypothetical protein
MFAQQLFMTTATALLWIFAVTYGFLAGMGSDNGDGLASIIFPFLLAYWVVVDARRRQRTLCYDFDSFVFFGWPILVPIYLFQTRGIRALLTLLYFLGLWIVAGAVAVAVSLSVHR